MVKIKVIIYESLKVFYLASVLTLFVQNAFAYSSGPPDGYAGDPPQSHICIVCHSSFPPNSGDGTWTISGIPTEYVPGDTYNLTITLKDPGQSRWGFEMTAITTEGLQGGTFVPLNQYVQVSEGPGELRDYIKHTLIGTFGGQDSAVWNFNWVAPANNAGEISFYAAFNAANFNFNPTGDYIYNGVITTVPTSISEARKTNLPGALSATVSPNPLSSHLRLTLILPEGTNTHAWIEGLNGRKIGEVLNGYLTKGLHLIDYPRVSSLKPGVYFLIVKAGETTVSRPFVIIKQ